MTRDGFMFLVMGFTGEKAAQIKIAYINAFNQMAATLYNIQNNPDQMRIGSKVQLNSGSPLFTITKFNLDEKGYVKDAEVIWHTRNKLHQAILPIQCLTLDQTNLIQNQTLDHFWTAIYNYGLGRLNHSEKSHHIWLNLNQVYQVIEGLPPKS